MKYRISLKTDEHDSSKLTRTFIASDDFVIANGFVVFQNNNLVSGLISQVAAFPAYSIVAITSVPEKTTT